MIEEWGESFSSGGGAYVPVSGSDLSVSSIVFMHSSHAERGAERLTIPRLAEIIRSLTTTELDALIEALGPDWPGTTGVREPRRPIRPKLNAGAALELVTDEED